MRLITVILYFILAIIVFASIGVTLPYCFETFKGGAHSIESLNQNIVTYFIAIFVSASLDYILRLIDDQASHRKPAILFVCLINVGVFLMAAYILYTNSKGNVGSISGWSILGVLIAYLMWWIANIKNSSFDINSSLGGDTNKPLTNG